MWLIYKTLHKKETGEQRLKRKRVSIVRTVQTQKVSMSLSSTFKAIVIAPLPYLRMLATFLDIIELSYLLNVDILSFVEDVI